MGSKSFFCISNRISFDFFLSRNTVRIKLNSSATGTASHTPSAPSPRLGSRNMAPTRKTNVFMQAIKVEILPLFRAEKTVAATRCLRIL